MAKHTSVTLGDRFEQFFAGQRVEALRAALVDGELSGEDSPLDMDEVIRSARREAGLDA